MLSSGHTEYLLIDCCEMITRENKDCANKTQTWSNGCHAESALVLKRRISLIGSQPSLGRGVACSQICMINSPVPGEHLEKNQVNYSISRPGFQHFRFSDALVLFVSYHDRTSNVRAQQSIGVGPSKSFPRLILTA